VYIIHYISHYTCASSTSKKIHSVPHDALWITMLDMRFPAHLVNIIMHLCHQNKPPQPSISYFLNIILSKKNCISFCSTGGGVSPKIRPFFRIAASLKFTFTNTQWEFTRGALTRCRQHAYRRPSTI